MNVNSRSKRFSASVSIAGAAALSFVCGAAVIFFQLPSSGWLSNAFLAARFWQESRSASPRPLQNPGRERRLVRANVDKPGKTFDGFTLYTIMSDSTDLGTQALLIDMRREVVHRWSIQSGDVQGDSSAAVPSTPACFFGPYLYPNGDLLVVLHGRDFGLAKLDAQSKLLWYCPRAIHHDVDVAEDGTIYALEKETIDSPPEGFEGIPVPCAVDSLLALSPEGKLLRKPIPILSAFRDSPYAALLATVDGPANEVKPPPGSTAPTIRRHPMNVDHDPLHTNCVRVLTRDLAAKFPSFKAGHVLISVRNVNLIAMLDPIAGRVEWAARGPWLAQHDPQFLENGRLLVFDNLGSPSGSRVLEYDPRTQALPWSYPAKGGPRFYSSERGMNQRLPNGNTFIVSSEGAQMIEVTPSGETVWSCCIDHFVASGRRYAPEQVRFLAPGTRPRP